MPIPLCQKHPLLGLANLLTQGCAKQAILFIHTVELKHLSKAEGFLRG